LGLSVGRSVAKPFNGTCLECRHSFDTSGAYDQRFCSDACRNKASNRRQMERNRSSKAELPPRRCTGCDAFFAPTYGDKRRDYCSRTCQLAAIYRLKSGHTHERRARKFGCFIEKVDKYRVFERDGWRCRICGVETPRHLSGTKDDRAPQLDHKVPLSKRGPHSYANTQCACRRCNRIKGDKLPSELRI
jgi:5-methylcytosine-specific restriction endonuclease McrA